MGRIQALERAIFLSASHLVIATDADGTIIDVNPAAEAALGYGRDELVGRTTPIILHDRHEMRRRAEALSTQLGTTVPPTMEVFLALARLGETDEHEWTYRRKDGSTFPVLLSVTALRGDDGELAGFVGIGSDLSLRNQHARAEAEVERLRSQRQAAERANAAKSRFLAAASHDLRQPFQAMRLFQSVLEASCSDPRQAAIIARLGEAMDGGERLLRALLDISTLDAGIVAAKPQPVAIGPLLERLAAEFTPQAEQQGLSLSVGGCASVVRTDPTLLERILRNLITNALRYTSQGEIRLGCRTAEDGLHVEVADTGRGIGPEHLDLIFEEFYQVDNPARDSSRGLGLGLSSALRMAKLLGHRIAVTSEPGVGSTFAVVI